MLSHATDVEQDLGLASYSMLHPGMSDSFLRHHRYFWSERHGTLCMFRKLSKTFLHPLHLTVAHGLDGYVKDVISTICERKSREWDHIYHLEASHRQIPWRDDPGSFRMSLLQCAIRHASKRFRYGSNRASQTRIIAVVLDHYQSCSLDAEMIFALGHSPTPKSCNSCCPTGRKGKMVLRVNTLESAPHFEKNLSRAGLLEFCPGKSEVGPLSCIAKREDPHDINDAAEAD